MKEDIIYYLKPEKDEFRELFYEALRRNKILIIIANCEVFYEGRSRSHLDPGERIIVIKKDRALLIHRPEGYKPVNWQPSQTELVIEDRENDMYLIGIRKRPHEKILIKIIDLYFILSAKLLDTGDFSMYLTEKEMQNILLKNLSIIEEGLRPITREKEIKSGKIDILAKDKRGNYVVIELKKHRIGEREVLQLYRYVKEIRETNPDVRGLIVGSSIDQDALEMLKTLKLEYKILNIKHLLK